MNDLQAVLVAQNILKKGFSFGRTALLLRNRVLDDAPTLGVGLAAIVGVGALNFLLSGYFFFNRSPVIWPLLIGFAGILLSAHAFKGMHDGKAGSDWLLLPAATMEKYLAAVVAYVIAFPVAASLVSTGLSALFALIENVAGQSSFQPSIWTPWHVPMLVAWGQYAVVSVLFIAGSASFRKNAFLKTAAIGVAYCLGLGIILGFSAWILMRLNGFAVEGFPEQGFFHLEIDLAESGGDVYLWIGRIAVYVILPLFGLAYGYFRVFEKEARDEVQ